MKKKSRKTAVWEDPIVAEVRRAREEIFAHYNYDLRAYMEDARRRTEELAKAGWKIKRLKPSHPKKAG